MGHLGVTGGAVTNYSEKALLIQQGLLFCQMILKAEGWVLNLAATQYPVMIQAMINYKNFITLRDYPTLDEARKVTPALPGKCLGYFDKVTNIFHIEKNAELGPDPERLLDGLTMLQDMRIREYRYLP